MRISVLVYLFLFLLPISCQQKDKQIRQKAVSNNEIPVVTMCEGDNSKETYSSD